MHAFSLLLLISVPLCVRACAYVKWLSQLLTFSNLYVRTIPGLAKHEIKRSNLKTPLNAHNSSPLFPCTHVTDTQYLDHLWLPVSNVSLLFVCAYVCVPLYVHGRSSMDQYVRMWGNKFCENFITEYAAGRSG